MANIVKPTIQLKLDASTSIQNINAQIVNEIQPNLKPVNISLNLNSDSIKNQTSQVQTQINNIAKANSSGFKVPIDFNVSADKIKEQLTTIVNKIRGGAKGQVIDFKVNLDEDGFLSDKSNVLIKYRNDANQVTESILKLKDTKEKLDDGTSDLRWTETLKSVSQNIEQTTKKAEQLTSAQQKQANSISELSEKYKTLQIQMSKLPQINGTNSLNSENIKGFQNAINSNDVQQATHYLSLLRTEYQQLNAEMSKKLPQNAIDNMQERAQSLSTQIDQITAKFSTLNTTGESNFTKNFSSQIEQANTSIKGLQKNLDTFNAAKTGQEQVTAFNQLNNSVKDSKVQVNDLVKAYQTLNRIEASAGSFEKYLQQNPQVLEKHAKQVNEIRNQWKQVSQETDITKLQTGFKEVNTSVSAFKGEIRSLGEEGRTVFGELGNDLKKQLQWLTSGSLLFGTIATIKKMADNVEDLSKSMVNLQIASGYNNDQMSSLMDTYSQMGQKMGATTTEVADSADAWLRQGKSVDESNTLIKDSMMLSKLGEIDSVQSTDYLTSAMKGYGVSVNNAVGIVDKLTKVDMESATSAGGLAEAMSKTANAANLAGVSMDQLLGMIAVVGETTQKSMDEVGTSFQAIFSRMGNVKAGKFVKDSESDVNDVETVLKKLGIQLRDSQGNFRNFGTVIDEIGNKWKSYSNLEQNAIATAVAGTRQRENFLVLMSNFNTALKYQETATNSAGTATQKYNDYTQGLEAHLKSATTAFQQLSRSVINSNTFSGLIDTGTGFLNILNTIVSKLGAIPTLIGAITAALSATKNVGKIYAYAA